ncbi:[protein-PII] uridylyltransferase [Methylocystis heyeri]|uniref:Bifunctional uridylyltransferase/uridylyl-removing enzyme n=1 Tax=Methylocystis heyeri TaxID=391905 RepID=A0A6B8KDS0_9HYPH|nr:[protein-PII] uridylyltransferase [Methylocystis heyeri]QGM44570.1 [protein-PII] uridylyltransferase [Methylocystis heyeri]
MDEQTRPQLRAFASRGSEPEILSILREELAERIAAACEGSATPEAARAAVLELIRLALDQGSALARAQLEAGGRGLACARFLSGLEDELIRAIHGYVVRYVYVAEKPTLSERLTIVAVGGYGRGALAPGSDIDLLFLLPYKQTPWGESVVEAILYMLWDLRQKVGHSTRSVSECLRQAKADMTIRTTLLEARFILGSEELFVDLVESFDREIVRVDVREFVTAKLDERNVRVQRAGASRYLVEPNVKEGKGGLRDLHTLFWIAKYVYRVREARELVAAGLFTSAEYSLFERCDEYLWRVRCHLHFATGRAEERLSFDIQPTMAVRLGYHDRGGLSRVERFMKHYFLVAKDVGDLTAIVCAALEERQAKPRAIFDRLIGRLKTRPKKQLSGDFVIDHDRVSVRHEDALARDPVNIIRLFWTADRFSLPLHPDALRAVTRNLRRIDSELRANPEANRLFLELLLSRNMTETVLRRMNETGALGRFIPDFGRIVAMMQFNMYHHYTVDEHLLRAVGALVDLEAGTRPEHQHLVMDILPTIVNRKVLYLGLLLHDIAKGRKEDHSAAGKKVALSLCPRLGFTPGETETVGWLVEQHLLMSSVAQSRDLTDPRTIENFAAVVQTIERLKMLFVLTVCDISAVGPGVLDAWKSQLLRALYWETEVVLGGGHSAVDRKSRVVAARDQMLAALKAPRDGGDCLWNEQNWTEEEFESYARRHYPAYWLKMDVQHKIRHAELLRSIAQSHAPLVVAVDLDQHRGAVELTVIAQDHRRLLSTIAGACAACGANIVDAHIFTTADGLALDTILCSRAFTLDDDELRRGNRIAEFLKKALRGDVVISEAIKARSGKLSQPTAFSVAPEVVIDNSLSHDCTVVEVSGLDREGLLFELTSVISRLNLNIVSAHITTFGERAVDVMYVKDLTGEKILLPSRQAAIRKQLLEIFSNGGEKEKKASGRPQKSPEAGGSRAGDGGKELPPT